jgi:hypothetical protein
MLDLWLVLEESPLDHRGYLVLFDEVSHEFGLGINGNDGIPVFLGFYGSFWQTLDGM